MQEPETNTQQESAQFDNAAAQALVALNAMADTPTVIPPPRPLPIGLMDFSEYEDILFNMLHQTEQQQAWASPLQYDTRDDLRYSTLPLFASYLRSYAADGELADLLSAQRVLALFAVREMIRAGQVPVRVPLNAVNAARPTVFG
jgi:hypothetical protein